MYFKKYSLSCILIISLLGCHLFPQGKDTSVRANNRDEKDIVNFSSEYVNSPLVGYFSTVDGEFSILANFLPFYLKVSNDTRPGKDRWRDYIYSRKGDIFYFCVNPTYSPFWIESEYYEKYCIEDSIAIYQIRADIQKNKILLIHISGLDIFHKSGKRIHQMDILDYQIIESITYSTRSIPFEYNDQSRVAFINHNFQRDIRLEDDFKDQFTLGSLTKFIDLDNTYRLQLTLSSLYRKELRLTGKQCPPKLQTDCKYGRVSQFVKYTTTNNASINFRPFSGTKILKKDDPYVFSQLVSLPVDMNPTLIDFFFKRNDQLKDKVFLDKASGQYKKYSILENDIIEDIKNSKKTLISRMIMKFTVTTDGALLVQYTCHSKQIQCVQDKLAKRIFFIWNNKEIIVEEDLNLYHPDPSKKNTITRYYFQSVPSSEWN